MCFGAHEVEYLGHIVSQEGVLVDLKKVAAMQDWTRPKTLNNLRGFLGLTGFYRKIMKIYGKIGAPLMSLLKKNAFLWSEEIAQAFVALKNDICTTPVLAVLYFNKTFVLECDASRRGVGEILMEDGVPLIQIL